VHAQVRKIGVAFPLLLAVGVTACASAGDAASPPGTTPGPYLARSHSHNNYLTGKPLTEALESGFASIEVDVFLVDGALLVAHDIEEVQQSATLEALYLDPLRDVCRSNGGSIYGPDNPPLQLLIDAKSDAEPTYRALHETLSRYSDILTKWTDRGPEPGAITVVLSGNRAVGLVEAAPIRYMAIDGRVNEGRASMSVDMMPLVSMDWEQLSATNLRGKLAEAEALVDLLHSEGRKVRFWGTPDREDLWESLVALGIDYVGTDDVPRLDRLLRRVGERSTRAIDE
jgi:glycerophosphoryl diester phosphodiesterase